MAVEVDPNSATGADTTGHYSAEPQLRRPLAFFRSALRDLATSGRGGWLLFRAGMRVSHRRAFFGYLWLVVPALAVTALCVLLRAQQVVQVNATSLPYPQFVLTGMLLWQVFIDGLQMPQQQLAAHRGLFLRSPTRHEVMLLAGMFQLLLGTGIRVLVLLVFLAATLPIGPGWAMVPVGAVLVALLGLAVGLFLAPVAILYEDVGRFIGIFAAFGLLITPIFFPVPERSLFWLNPVTPLIEGTRAAVSASPIDPLFYMVGLCGLLGSVAGWLFYRVAQPHLIARAG